MGHLVLGAYGCGVFRNDPEHVTAAFDTWLRGAKAIGHCVFKKITFAIPGRGDDRNFQIFEERFGDHKAKLPQVKSNACMSGEKPVDSSKRNGRGAGKWRK